MPDRQIKIEIVVTEMFEENVYIVALEGESSCVVIDPGLSPEKIIARLDELKLTPQAILVTHGHYDHIGGCDAIKARWPDVELLIGENEASKLTDPLENLSADFGLPRTAPPATRTLSDGETFEAVGIEWKTREIPGHSKGHVVYKTQVGDTTLIFVGDVIFQRSIGRTDFPDGDFEALERGIKEKLYTLPDDTKLYPGHGPMTTVGDEKRLNPFVRGEEK